ncbi:glycosyltransferase family 4 protein [Ichthyenterobacterium magnum]|uniref:Glycosyltransferase involved in cell wall biosynthesis n=1 Tax=Ichthyenterobacterium magnum TaxID=1230530 RepID=A0A420DUQ3_9FLAO|nr:glycosyltransferase family 4 protein [Ichthyenterobacterium magnum]RKE97992.1 glycosyltransferase involved in cell wall biosynthesis [Ichthyenterobacterium magnum]
MNIAIFTPNQNPYSETFIQAHKNYLKGNVFYYYGVGEHIKIEGHQLLRTGVSALIQKIKRKVFKKPYHYLWTNAIITSLKKHRIDSVLIEYGTHAYHLLPVLNILNIPIVVHFHGYDASVKHVIEHCNYYKDVFALAHKVIAVSKPMEQMLLQLGCPKAKLVYNVYGPQPEFLEVEATFSKQQFIAIGRFTNKKAPYYTIMAFKEVLSKYPEALLLMAGDGALLNACRNLVKHYNIESNVKFLGVITPEAFRGYLSESLAFVQHSVTADNGDMEGTPLAVLEASAAGLPVISTYHAGIPDVILHKETGLLCEAHDVATMREHMLSVLNSTDYAKQLGVAGRVRIKTYFSLERHIKKLDKMLII